MLKKDYLQIQEYEILKYYTLYYILLVYERELSKDDYLRPLLITIIKSIKNLKIIQTDKKKVTT